MAPKIEAKKYRLEAPTYSMFGNNVMSTNKGPQEYNTMHYRGMGTGQGAHYIN